MLKNFYYTSAKNWKFRLVENGVLDTQRKRSKDEKNPGGYVIQSIFSKIKSVKLKKKSLIFLLIYKIFIDQEWKYILKSS